MSGYGNERRKVLVLGAKKSGKTSSLKAVFEGMTPKDTIWLETTQQIVKTDFDSILPLELWDTPGSFDLDSITWEEFSTVVYMLDVSQDTHHPISKIVPTFILAYAQNPSINFEVFIHKADHWDADWQDEDFREITGRVMDEIADFSDWASLADTHPNVRFNVDADAWLETLTTEKIRFWLTSIHNYTIYEAWSKVIQRLMEDIYGTIEGLLNTFGQQSSMHKSFLFDINAKLYVAMDINSVESSTFQLCSDYLGRMMVFQSLFDNVPEARKQARSEKAKREGKRDPTQDEDDDEDPEEREWPANVARLGENTSICYWQFTKRLALMSVVSSDVLNQQQGMIEFNVALLRKAILQILEAIGQ
ncbi:hypothetical protein FFLO_01263 [Filobasidium floriforme]|uniref:GTP-binding protein n=1 Tax=Filobasidium floriforme TaxID=5210 RepID=A0A8K0JRS8_9TREE|nr:hypothetical protein FFLO_01263 [Filobasidium floriforme]